MSYYGTRLCASIDKQVGDNIDTKRQESKPSGQYNYRGITLCNAIAKVLGIYILDRYNEYFYTSDMQYAFKEGHSTVMCTTVLKEIVAIYNARGSNCYACLLDVSKAFARANHEKPFSMLLARQLPAIFV